jgi:hypothetical protein
MNVLILTPDAVGSTLLQRLITIYMQFHEFDRPVINLHELTNGLEKYYSPEFNREILSKRKVEKWGYYQSLEQVMTLLNSVDHYKTSRLAQYHIKRRQDPLEKQIPFYQYLDDNFFIIACRRHNIFEHALSMSLNKNTKKLNVYSHQEKIGTFINMYLKPTCIDERVFVRQLEAYKDYLEWSDQHFNIGSYFYYDEHLENIEQYILNLPIFDSQHKKITWQDKFNIHFNDWNRLHHIPSDLGSLPSAALEFLKIHHDSKNTKSLTYNDMLLQAVYPSLDSNPVNKITKDLSDHVEKEYSGMSDAPNVTKMVEHYNQNLQNFIKNHKSQFEIANAAITSMTNLDIIVSPPPIKKHTLGDKMKTIENFDRCLEIFNQWILNNQHMGTQITSEDLRHQQAKEQQYWKSFIQSVELSDQQTIEKLGYQSGDNL